MQTASLQRTTALKFHTLRESFFQLEELEDASSAVTEVFLKTDRTIDVGETDGPIFVDASGTWNQDLDGKFEMILKRTYKGGAEQRKFTDMGEFEFEVERTFTGQLTEVGGKVAVAGSMHCADETLGDSDVGYFNMLETTKERLGEEDEE